jgi:hypothetical protein
MKAEKSPNRTHLLRSPARSALSRPTTPSSSSLRHQSKETIEKLASQSLTNGKRKHTPSPTNSPSSFRHQSKATIEQSASPSLTNAKRKRTPSPVHSPSRPLPRYDTFASDYDTGNPNRWTKQHWKKLESYYLRKGRDVQKTANAFYYGESLKTISLPSVDDAIGRPVTDELWTKDQVLWRTNCLHTSVEYNQGLLPSQRSSSNKKRKITTNTSTATNTPSRSNSAMSTNS